MPLLNHGDRIQLIHAGPSIGNILGWSVADIGQWFTFDRYEGFGCLKVIEKSDAWPILAGSFENKIKRQ